MHERDMQLHRAQDQSRLSSITLYTAEALHCKLLYITTLAMSLAIVS